MSKKRQVVKVNEEKLKMMMAGEIPMELEPSDLTIIRGNGAVDVDIDTSEGTESNQKVVDGKENKEEEKSTKRKKNSKRNYNEVFLCKPIPVFRKSRTIQLEEELYFKILKLTSVPGNAISIANFINNLLCNHFEIYEEDINEIYQSMIDSVYKNNNL